MADGCPRGRTGSSTRSPEPRGWPPDITPDSVQQMEEVSLLSNKSQTSTSEASQRGPAWNSFTSKRKAIIYSAILISGHCLLGASPHLYPTPELSKYLSLIFHKITIG